MIFNSLIFLFIFLPITLCGYYLIKNPYRDYYLVFISLLFYACGSVDYFTLLMISLLVTIGTGRIISKSREFKIIKILVLIIGIIYNVSILGYYKYLSFIADALDKLISIDITQSENIVLPLGISFFTFKSISYLIDIYQGKVELSTDISKDVLYLSFWGQIQSGPISRYSDFNGNSISKDLLLKGVFKFVIGFEKKVIIADTLAHIVNEVFSSSLEGYSTIYAWLGSICFSLQLYYDFSGYSDMAIGITNMFGYSCPENFDYPYTSKTVSEFWRRWHITLGSWFRDYVYIPLGGSRKGLFRTIINILIVWILTGIWHGADWTFVFWGIGYFIVIAFEKITLIDKRMNSKPGKAIYSILVLLFINFQWVIFRSEGIRKGVGYLKTMLLPVQNSIADARALFLMKDYAFFIIIAVLFAFPIDKFVSEKFNTIFLRTYYWVKTVIITVGFIWSISLIVAGQNNPFAYMNF